MPGFAFMDSHSCLNGHSCLRAIHLEHTLWHRAVSYTYLPHSKVCQPTAELGILTSSVVRYTQTLPAQILAYGRHKIH